MEFIDEDTKPRFLFQSRNSSPSHLLSTPKISKLHAATCLSSSATLFITAFLLSLNSILFSLLIWFSLSLLLAPFAPLHTTGGDPHVGRGDFLPPPPPKPSDSDEPRRRPSSRWNPKTNIHSSVTSGSLISKPDEKRGVNRGEEWSNEDFEIVKRQISKHPAGSMISKPDEKRGVDLGELVMKEANRGEGWSVEDFEIVKRQISKHPAGSLISKPDEKGGVDLGELMMKEANRGEEWSIEGFDILKRQISKNPAGSLISNPDGKRGVNLVTKEANRGEEWSVEDFDILKRQISKNPAGSLISKPDVKRGVNSVMKEAKREEEWSVEDFDILKRQILKHPVGAPGRWERVAEVFKGRHGVESVIHAAKSLAERRSTGDDSFALFLKQRKPLEKQVDAVNVDCCVSGSVGWSSGEDIALLNALKLFPKDAAMRWEKVAAAVPGKSKVECVKRVAELKRDFRSSKMS